MKKNIQNADTPIGEVATSSYFQRGAEAARARILSLRKTCGIPEMPSGSEIKTIFQNIKLGENFRSPYQLEALYQALYRIIAIDFDSTFNPEDKMHWYTLVPLLVNAGCTIRADGVQDYYIDLFEAWFPDELHKCNAFINNKKNTPLGELKKQIKNTHTRKILTQLLKNPDPLTWKEEYNKIAPIHDFVERFFEYIKNY